MVEESAVLRSYANNPMTSQGLTYGSTSARGLLGIVSVGVTNIGVEVASLFLFISK